MNAIATSLAAPNTALRGLTELSGRSLLAGLFLISGVGKLSAFEATAGYMSSVGAPASLLPAVIATEVGGAIAVMLGFKTRLVSVLLAAFTLLTAVLFHADFGDQMQQIMFLKNVSIAGGFLILAANGGGRFSLDQLRGK